MAHNAAKISLVEFASLRSDRVVPPVLPVPVTRFPVDPKNQYDRGMGAQRLKLKAGHYRFCLLMDKWLEVRSDWLESVRVIAGQGPPIKSPDKNIKMKVISPFHTSDVSVIVRLFSFTLVTRSKTVILI